jgi:apolipoprotein N-acyltransferase
VSLPPDQRIPLDKKQAAAAAIASGLLYWLAFAGKVEAWPLSLLTFVCFVPLYIALQGQTVKRAVWIGVLTGATMNIAGFYWLVTMLKTFSGFPTAICLLLVVIICTYQGGRLGLMGWLHARASARGWPAAPVFALAFAVSEFVFPLLFPWYYATTVHKLPILTQTAEIAGPIFVGLILVGVNLAIAEPLLARLEKRAPDRRIVIAGACGLLFALLYGAVRIPMVDAHALSSEPLKVGVVQGNMGLMEKRSNHAEGLRRHQKMTKELKDRGAELVVWSESSVMFSVNEKMANQFMHDTVASRLGVPTIFGAVLWRDTPGDRERWFNVALATDTNGNNTGRYDKEYLLAFGEYLPFGDTFPILHEWSPNSGKFSAGTELEPLRVTTADGKEHKVTALICYEDILPSFTNEAVRHADPELLVNMTNDAWFGDSSEPWEHLALAEFRAIEHRRYLVRSTNSGVSAVIDPVGRVIAKTETFKAERLDAVVHWMREKTPYEVIGDAPWYLATLAIFVGAFRRRRPEKVAN